MSRTLVFSCPHTPCMLPPWPDSLSDMRRRHKTTNAVCLGDVADNRILNYHEKNPDLPGPAQEYAEAKTQIAILHKMFPNIDVLVGNHDALPIRKARTAGIPSWFMRDMNECWNTPKWKWWPRYHTLIDADGVAYRHGDRGHRGMVRPALLNAQRMFRSLCQGHYHPLLHAMWEFNEHPLGAIFGMQVGCGMDWHRAEMEYGLVYPGKPAIGCGIVIDGRHAYTERMVL